MKPEYRHHYGHHWRTVLRPETLKRAGGQFVDGRYVGFASCERCSVLDLLPDGRSILDVAHLDGDPANNDPANRAALCKSCHARYDAPAAKPKRKATRLDRKDGARAFVVAGEVLEIG
jgi:hypothetical protein